MDSRRALIVDAFTDEPLAGNPAGVLPDADGLDAEQMAAIAAELGASETAFVLETVVADRRMRFFTPAGEIDLCGHATVAAHAHLLSDGAIEPGDHTVETSAGVLDVSVEAGGTGGAAARSEAGEASGTAEASEFTGTVWLTMDAPTVREVDLDASRVADVLGIDPVAVVTGELPIAVASTGLPYLIVPLDYLSALGSVDPDFDAVETLATEFDATGVYAFTFDTLRQESTLHGRMFAPGEGIPEDPVTGTASGAAGAYLRHAGAFDAMPGEMVFEQGHYVDRPGRVRVRVGEEVQVGGEAATSLDGEILVPETGDDGIIEA